MTANNVASLGMIGITSTLEFGMGIVCGTLIDAVFPSAKPDAPFLVEAGEVLGETALIGMMTATVGKFFVDTISPENSTGGFPFFIGISNGIGNYTIKVQKLIAKSKILLLERAAGNAPAVQVTAVKKEKVV